MPRFLIAAVLLTTAAIAAVPQSVAPAENRASKDESIPPIPAPLDFPLPKLAPAGNDFPVTDFGAFPDGKTNNTTAIQRAIDTCSAAGGGTVVLAKTDAGTTF